MIYVGILVLLAFAAAVEVLCVEIAGWRGALGCTAVYVFFAVQIALAHAH